MKIFDIINEEHFNLSSNEEPTKPFKNDDTITVYHGFRDIDDAILTVKHGTSGALRVSRVYSYESDNNPKGLFVTPNLNTAKNFGNTIIEFDSRFDELEPPVWPSGSYTGYGQYSQYWGRGREGRAKRSKAQTQLRNQYRTDNKKDYIKNSDDPLLAYTLTNMGETQALYVGHLNPNRIKAIHLRDIDPSTRSYTSDWYTLSPDQFLEKYKNFDLEKNKKAIEIYDRIYKPDDVFDPNTFVNNLKQKYSGYGDIDDILEKMWTYYVLGSKTNKGQAFKEYFTQFLWPKQIPDAFNWFKRKYGIKKGGD